MLRRSIAACITLFAGTASAQTESAATVVNPEPEKKPEYTTKEVEVHGEGKSPAWTQTRSFAATRFWRLDAKEQEVQIWYYVRAQKDGDPDFTRHVWQVEYMVSPFKGLQLDFYANYKAETGKGHKVDGAQFEARIAPWNYGQVFLNPTLYLELYPRYQDSTRGEVRLLLGGEIVRRLRAAVNFIYEVNLDSETGAKKDYITDREVGGTGAIAYEIIPRMLGLGGETRIILDEQGGDTFKKTYKVGPALWVSTDGGHWFFTTTVMFGLNDKTDRFNPLFVAGYRP